MNNSEDNLHEADSEVGAAYRELAQEQAPERIDAAVLGMARKAVDSGSGLSKVTTWLRPLTFVATAGLSLALIVQLNNTPDIDIPDSIAPGVTPLPADAFQDAASQTAEQLRQLEQNPGMSLSADPPATATPVAESTRELSLLPANERCDDEARASSGTWWQCVRELEQRGLPEAAERELQVLLKTFPQFSAPQ